MLKLFITFFKIGALTFGGSCHDSPDAEEIIAQGWLTQAEFLNMSPSPR